MNKNILIQLQSKRFSYLIEIATINTLLLAPRYMKKYMKRFKKSRMEQTWSNFVAWLETILPENMEFDLVDNKTLIFKGAIETDRLATSTTDILTKLED